MNQRPAERFLESWRSLGGRSGSRLMQRGSWSRAQATHLLRGIGGHHDILIIGLSETARGDRNRNSFAQSR
jgi:hypothetical protein